MSEGIYESFQNPKIKIGKLKLHSSETKETQKPVIKEPPKKKHKFNII